jgi:hypothetical protein
MKLPYQYIEYNLATRGVGDLGEWGTPCVPPSPNAWNEVFAYTFFKKFVVQTFQYFSNDKKFRQTYFVNFSILYLSQKILLLFEIKSPFSDLRILKEKILIFLKCKN